MSSATAATTTSKGSGNSSARQKRKRVELLDARIALLNKLKQGLQEVDDEMRKLHREYASFVQSGNEADARLESWKTFFGQVDSA